MVKITFEEKEYETDNMTDQAMGSAQTTRLKALLDDGKKD